MDWRASVMTLYEGIGVDFHTKLQISAKSCLMKNYFGSLIKIMTSC